MREWHAVFSFADILVITLLFDAKRKHAFIFISNLTRNLSKLLRNRASTV